MLTLPPLVVFGGVVVWLCRPGAYLSTGESINE